MITLKNNYKLKIAIVALAFLSLSCFLFSQEFHFVWDDYRYLAAIKRGLSSVLQTMVVENRWNQSWWIPEGTYIRFFRPFVILSYWADFIISNYQIDFYVLTNLLLHCLATYLGFKLLGYFLPSNYAFGATMLFFLHGIHFENLTYIAGRTDTIAAIFAFGTLSSYANSLTKRSYSSYPLAWFLFALIAKEYNLLLVPACLFIERLIDNHQLEEVKRYRFKLFIGAVFIVLGYALVCHFILGDRGEYVFPYIYSPIRDGFLSRTIVVSLSYLSGLMLGSYVPPFLNSWEHLTSMVAPWEIYTSIIFTAFFSYGLKTKKGRVLAGLALIFIIPLLPLYSTSRYLYIPSLFSCAYLFNFLLSANKIILKLAVLIPAALTVLFLFGNIDLMGHRPNEAKIVVEKILNRSKSLSPNVITIINFPYSWLADQFLNDALFVFNQNNSVIPKAVILNRESFSSVIDIRKIDDNSLELSLKPAQGQHNNYLLGSFLADFDSRIFSINQEIIRPDYLISVIEMNNGFPTRIRVRFKQSILNNTLMQYMGSDLVETITYE